MNVIATMHCFCFVFRINGDNISKNTWHIKLAANLAPFLFFLRPHLPINWPSTNLPLRPQLWIGSHFIPQISIILQTTVKGRRALEAKVINSNGKHGFLMASEVGNFLIWRTLQKAFRSCLNSNKKVPWPSSCVHSSLVIGFL